ncbi:serine hydrolase [Alteromonas sediminis]|uniref:Serine hydrolase n=1 Tax=Alteromonas sediminis TaxID=2259342 RepID=A0A3N5Y1R8_9ALTE|nr:serine hydrolase domain-containing protein [Alteromonas sediminis]RPJ67642.1 serine hydrolase [Alteromonas sediminis]
MNYVKKVNQFRYAIYLSLSFVAMQAGATASFSAGNIDKYLSDNVDRGVSASILVVKNDTILINKGYGLANRDSGLANSPSTVFDIGSLTKQFTSAAILKLVELDKLKLSDTLDIYFSNLPDDKKPITVHQLLTHTSGFKEFPGRDFDSVSKEDYFQTVFSSELEFTPGERYKYSNVGYSILSSIIEQVAQTSYETFLSKVFFEPLQMTQTGYLLPDWKSSELAHGYYEDFYDRGTSIERYEEGGVSPILVGNGGLQSTVSDLHKWLIALDDNKVLSKESIQLLTTKHVQTPAQVDASQHSTSYGYGWKIGSNTYSEHIISHNGNNGTFRSSIVWRPNEDSLVIFLSNTESRGTLWLAYEIDKMLANDTYQPDPIEPNPFRVIDEYVKRTETVSDIKLLAYYQLQTGNDSINSSVINHLTRIYFHFNEHTDWALELLKLNVNLHPDDGNLWDSLGEGYIQLGQRELALASFRMSLTLAPEEGCHWCENAQKKIESLMVR